VRTLASVKYILWLAVAVSLLTGACLWLYPCVLSTYYLEAGGRRLDASLLDVGPDSSGPAPVADQPRLDSAVDLLGRSLEQDPKNVQALRLLARALRSKGQLGAAEEALLRAREIRPRSRALSLELGDVYDSLGDAKAAVAAYEAGQVGSRDGPLAANYTKLADAQLAAGSGDLAIELWRRILDIRPGNPYALQKLLEIHRQMGDYVHAVQFARELEAPWLEDPSSEVDPRMWEYQWEAACSLIANGDWSRQRLHDVAAYYARGGRRGNIDALSEATLEALAQKWPEDPLLVFYLGDLADRGGQHARASQAYRRAISIEPDLALAYERLGAIAERDAGSKTDAQSWSAYADAAEWYASYLSRAGQSHLMVALNRLAGVCAGIERATGVVTQPCADGARRVVGQDSDLMVPDVDLVGAASVLREAWIEHAADREPEFAVEQQIGGGWTLLGYDIDDEAAVRGEAVDVTLYWLGNGLPASGEEHDGWYRAGGRWVQVQGDVRSILPNGGFELGRKGVLPLGIERRVPGGVDDDLPLLKSRRADQNTMVAVTESGHSGLATAYVPVRPGGVYLFGGWVQSRGTGSGLGWTWDDEGDLPNSQDATFSCSPGPNGWCHCSALVLVPRDREQCQLWLINRGNAGPARFDNVVFVGIAPPFA
jgi:tetratricopeptide (TPR) repeat protein